jgi:excisionase family DNA binding protein
MDLQLLTIRQVSELLAAKESTVRTWINRKQFPDDVIVRIGNTVRFRRSKLEEWLNYGCLQKA